MPEQSAENARADRQDLHDNTASNCDYNDAVNPGAVCLTCSEPGACGACGVSQRGHGWRWQAPVGLHQYHEPTDEQRLDRMVRRRTPPGTGG